MPHAVQFRRRCSSELLRKKNSGHKGQAAAHAKYRNADTSYVAQVNIAIHAYEFCIIGNHDETQQCGWHGERRQDVNKNDDVFERRARNQGQPPGGAGGAEQDRADPPAVAQWCIQTMYRSALLLSVKLLDRVIFLPGV